VLDRDKTVRTKVLCKFYGFSLAELLIAVAILGEIATFTIPKLISAQQMGKRQMVLKQTVSMLSDLTYRGYLMKQMSGSYNGTYYIDNVNALKVCSNNSSTEGCWSHTAPSTENVEPGFVLHNGAVVAGFNNVAEVWGYNGIIMDWNGATGPNLEGDDQITFIYYYNNNSGRGGTLIPYGAASTSLYKSIFQ
jgi:prepilin-type N-terminal cleavage/methylation domain-containing protein